MMRVMVMSVIWPDTMCNWLLDWHFKVNAVALFLVLLVADFLWHLVALWNMGQRDPHTPGVDLRWNRGPMWTVGHVGPWTNMLYILRDMLDQRSNVPHRKWSNVPHVYFFHSKRAPIKLSYVNILIHY